MNILFFQDTLGVSGGEIWASDAAVKLRQKGHHIVMGCPTGSWMERQATTQQLPYFNYLPEEAFEGHLRWRLCEIIQEEKIDLICCGIPGMRIEAPLLDAAIREAGRGCIMFRLGVAPGPHSLAPERLGLHLETVRGIIVVSQDIKKRLTEAFPTLPPNRIHVHYNGVDVEKFNPETYSSKDRQIWRASLNIPETHQVIGTVGRLDPIKNVPMLIQATSRILTHFPQTTFVVAGEGAEKQHLIETARQAGVLEHFRFPGFTENVPCLLHGLDILAHTSFSEGVPNAVLEGMAMGKPVVATDVGGIPELIQNGQNGILIPSNDVEKLAWTLCDLLKNPHKQQTLGQAACLHVKTKLNRRIKLDALETLFISEADQARIMGVPELSKTPQLYDLPDFMVKNPFSFRKVQTLRH